VEDVVAPQEPSAWIEVELRDDLGTPLSGVPYTLTLSDGTVEEGVTGKDGTAGYLAVPEGLCTLRFADVDASDWVVTHEDVEAPSRGTGWVAFELRDDDGPVVDEP